MSRRWIVTGERFGLQTAHRDDGKRFIVPADEKLTAFRGGQCRERKQRLGREHSAGCYSSRFHESAHGAFNLFCCGRPIANTDSDDRSSMPG